MSITIQINPSLEKRLREKANHAGVGLDNLIEQVLETWSEAPLPGGSNPEKSTENKLLQKINSTGFSDDFWVEYKMLIQKRQREAIEKEELARLIKMSDRLEKANVQRMKYLIELSRLRNVSVRELMHQLGISSENHA
ncbi:MAG TPA: hypothetical protein PK228_19360 [Saprospiraceae bacterium]|nr:hypothetical protein [Saprospiraceae bacterium]